MTLGDLLQRLDGYCAAGQLLHGGDPAQALSAARGERHPDPVYGEAVRMLADWTVRDRAEQDIDRAAAVAALGPLRRRYMLDDAPPDGLRKIQTLVEAIDAAFDDERLDSARSGASG